MTVAEHRSWVTRIGLLVVAAAAAVMSFTALSDLARLVGITSTVGPGGGWSISTAALLPITVDVYAAVATWVWLQARAPADALEFARRSAWSAIGVTVVGNAVHGGLVAAAVSPSWWMAVLIGAIPPAALGALVHLAVLVGRRTDQLDQSDQETAEDPWWVLLDRLGAEPWERAIGGWSARSAAAARTVPDREQPDEVLAADLRSVTADQGRPLSRDDVIERYGIGATRAARVRQLADQPTGPTAAPATAVA